jgi:NSS family neurotransmitter:Na+ symporter
MFEPDFSKLIYKVNASGNRVLTMEGIWTALGHAFFTLSLGMGAIMVYGSYLRRDVSIGKAAVTIALADTSIGLLAGLAVFPVVFTNNMSANAGPSLIFETLPVVFGAIPGGAFVGGLFFVLLLFAAWTSAVSLIEPAVAWLVENRRFTRVRAATTLGVLVWLLGIASIYSATGVRLGDIVRKISSFFGVIEKPFRGGIYDMDWFLLIDALTARILLPLGGLSVIIFVAWRMRTASVRQELDFSSRRLFNIWYFVARYVTPIAVIAVFIIGIINGFFSK